MNEPVGVVGLGNMGLPMVARLVASGRSVIAYARTDQRAEVALAAGARVVRSIGELADATQTILLSLPADADVETVLLGDDGLCAHLGPGALVVDTSTISPATARRLAATLAAHGIDMIDRDFAPRGTVKMQRKDVHVIQDLARSVGIDRLPAFDVAATNVVRLDEVGGGALDHSALVQILEQETGVTL